MQHEVMNGFLFIELFWTGHVRLYLVTSSGWEITHIEHFEWRFFLQCSSRKTVTYRTQTRSWAVGTMLIMMMIMMMTMMMITNFLLNFFNCSENTLFPKNYTLYTFFSKIICKQILGNYLVPAETKITCRVSLNLQSLII